MPLIVLLLAGIVLRANPDWFNGAHTAGTVCLAFGLLGVLFVVLALVGAIGTAAAAARTPKPRKRMVRR